MGPLVLVALIGLVALFVAGDRTVGRVATLVFVLAVGGSKILLHRFAEESTGRRAAARVLGAVGWGDLLVVPAHAWLHGFAGAYLVEAWGFAIGAGFSLLSSQKGVLRDFDAAVKAGRRREKAAGGAVAIAFVFLVAGLGLVAWGGWSLVSSVVESRRIGVVLGAVWGLYGARQLLNLAARGRTADAPGAGGWLRANWVSVAVVSLVLAAYLAFRDALAEEVPYFPLIEFGFGVSVFGFALAFLRHRVKRTLAEKPVVSPSRAHVPRLEIQTEAEFEALKRPLEAFIESGRGVVDYSSAVRGAARLDEATATDALEPVAAYRRPPRVPALPLPWEALAGAVATAGFAFGLFDFMSASMAAPDALARTLAGVVFGFGVYRLQDPARRAAKPVTALLLGVVGVAIVGVSAVAAIGFREVATAPPPVLYAAAGVVAFLLAVPVVASWRLKRRLDRGEPLPEPHESPADEIAHGIHKARKRVFTLLAAVVVAAILVPPVLASLAQTFSEGPLVVAGDFFDGFGEFYGLFVAFLASTGLGLAAGGAIRWAGLAGARERVLREAARRRAERLALHREVMRRLAAG